jgi:hypothetical protein
MALTRSKVSSVRGKTGSADTGKASGGGGIDSGKAVSHVGVNQHAWG